MDSSSDPNAMNQESQQAIREADQRHYVIVVPVMKKAWRDRD